jgi:hypothetical protein
VVPLHAASDDEGAKVLGLRHREPHQTGTFQSEKEHPVISLATKYWREKRNYGANLTINLSRYKPLS